MLKVHHLRVGRSVFTVWLIEELGLDYELQIYDRNPETFRAPPELKTAHPLGKSPVIEDQGMTIAESGAISTYLVETYDKDRALQPPEGDIASRVEYLQWLHYPEGSVFAPLLMKLLLMRCDPKPPVFEAFSDKEVSLHLGFIADGLAGKPYILGDSLKTPDIELAYVVQMANRLGLTGSYPTLEAYLKRVEERPAFKRAMEKTGG